MPWGGILVIAAYRLWFALHLGLVADEAYYWLWAKNLAASYRDKGPGIAWAIAFSTWLFGDTVLGIRFFAVWFWVVLWLVVVRAGPDALR